MRKTTKIVISFAVVLIAGLNFIIPAFAQDPFSTIAIGGLSGLSGAGLFSSMAGMSGININYNSTDPMDAMWNVLNPDHVYFSGEKHEADPQEVPTDVYDYITVNIGDWLNAQSDFITNFAQTYSVTDNSSGTVTEVANFDGIPVNTNVFSNVCSPVLDQYGPLINGSNQFTLSSGAFEAVCSCSLDQGILKGSVSFYYNGSLVATKTNQTFGNPAQNLVYGLRLRSVNGDIQIVIMRLDNGYMITSGTDYIGQLTQQTTTSWNSGTVNLSVFDGWESAKVKIPHNLGVLPVNWDIPDFVDAINQLWENNQQGQIVIEDSDTPVPPPPVPSTPLGDVPFDDWIDLWGQGIYQQLENQSDTLDLIGSNGIDAIEELESIDTNTEDLVETAESIDTNIGIGNGILGGIRSLAQSAVDYLEGIAEHVGELVEEIVEGTETLIAGILNQIPQAFGVIFGPIKQASSIWHYVVEWIQSIGAPFQFIWSMASGTSYYMILPVYASLAGAVVLAFFKRFGR